MTATDVSIVNAETRIFWMRRIHSLFGVIPLAFFMFEHLMTNSLAAFGAARFNEAVWTLQRLPYLRVLEIGFIGIPLGFHAIYGVAVLLTSRPTVQDYPFTRNVLYTLQRLTGIVAFVFIALHVLATRLSIEPTPTFDFFAFLKTHLGSGAIKAGYTVGVLSTVFHFANGLTTFCITWGFTLNKRSQLWASYAFSGLGLVLAAWGVRAIYAF